MLVEVSIYVEAKAFQHMLLDQASRAHEAFECHTVVEGEGPVGVVVRLPA